MLAALDEGAEALGLKPGTGVADARAMHPGLEVREAEPEADQRLLERLADWSDRYTPLVALAGTDGLFLDLSGCAHLFGGEGPLLEDALARLARQGFRARADLASTPGAAWAAARFAAPPAASIPPGEEAAALKNLPPEALRLDAEVCAALRRVGLRLAGQLLEAPRAPLARRFGPKLLTRLDQALGRLEEAISPRLAPAPLSAERHLPEPILETEAVEALAQKLAETLEDDLARRGEGARRLELALFRVDGRVFRVALNFSRAVRDPCLVGRILRERLAALDGRIEAGFGFDLLRLSVLEAAPFDAAQGDWLEAAAPGEATLAALADRLEARLGPRTLVQALPAASHVPERAVRLQPFVGGGTGEAVASDAPCLPRPLRLLEPPEPVEVTAQVPDGPPLQFRWRRVLFRVAASDGPERIAPEWWQDEAGPIALELPDGVGGCEAPLTRDYFHVEDFDGRRFWLFRLGLYGAGSAQRLAWFLHGLSA